MNRRSGRGVWDLFVRYALSRAGLTLTEVRRSDLGILLETLSFSSTRI